MHIEFVKASDALSDSGCLEKLSPFIMKTTVFVPRSEEATKGSANFFP
jgi:hypothetical protein